MKNIPGSSFPDRVRNPNLRAGFTSAGKRGAAGAGKRDAGVTLGTRTSAAGVTKLGRGIYVYV